MTGRPTSDHSHRSKCHNDITSWQWTSLLSSLLVTSYFYHPQLRFFSQVTGPRSFPRGTPVLAGGPPVLAGGYPGWGIPWPGQDWGSPPPKTEQQSEHLLRSGQYASCLHAEGLSGFIFLYEFQTIILTRLQALWKKTRQF